MPKVVAGVDGSNSAANAVAWAAREAARRGDTLLLVHSYVVPVHGYPSFLATFPELREGMRHYGSEWLEQARQAAQQAAPGVEVEVALREGEPVTVLRQESREARAVVLGSRGLGGFTGMLVGSVAVALAAHGHCPVVVVRGKRQDDPPPPPASGPVVVGVDGSDAGLAALGFGFEAAEACGESLVAVHTWNDVVIDSMARLLPLSADPAEVDTQERAALEKQLSGWREKYPDVTVDPVVVRGRPVPTLLEYGERARLLVVGSRGRGGFTGMLLGSTSQALVIHAPCPVAVLRPRREPGT
jgi:nucleotide-binding universal stress UspA family protein